MKENIGKLLKAKRQHLGLTVKEVVTMLAILGIEVSEKTIYGWESGRRQPDADTFITICKVYNISDMVEYFSQSTNNQPNDFTPTESALLENYRLLNEQGQEKASGNIQDLVDTGKYKKHNPNELDNEKMA